MLSYKNKIFIDRTFGSIAVLFMKVLARLLGLILRRDHTIPHNPKVIAVAKIVGLGSIVYTGILCRSLKEKFPESRLVYITSYGSLELIKRMNYIDDVLLINDKNITTLIGSSLSLVIRLWCCRPILYFDMEVYSSWAALIATLSLALNRYGFYRMSSNFKKGMHTHMVFFNTKRHISQVYGQLALSVGSKANRNLAGLLNTFNEDRELCSQILSEIGVTNLPIILVNVNSSDLLIERRWPAEKWIDYLEQIVLQLPNYNFLLTGTPGEVGYVSTLYIKLSQKKTREKVFNVTGKFPLGPFLTLIEKCDLMVTNDSGPLHFAVALNKPTVSLWGPGAPEHYAPVTGTHKIIYEPVYCSPCLYHADVPPCEGNNVCMENIQVGTVLEATKEIVCLFESAEFNPVIKHR